MLFASVINSFQLMTADRLALINPHNLPITQKDLPIIQCEEVQKGKREEVEIPLPCSYTFRETINF